MTGRDQQFGRVAVCYDLLMQAVPYPHWVTYVEEILQRRGAHVEKVLDVACGTGNVTEEFVRRGYEAVGVDISRDMIEQARRKVELTGKEITFVVSDAAEMEIPQAPFDLAVSLFDSLNYIIDPARLATAIHRVYNHLRPNGLFVFDVNTPFALEQGFFDQNCTSPGSALRYRWISSFDAEQRLCRVDMKFDLRWPDGVEETFNEVHHQRAHTNEEIRTMLQNAGFVDIEGFRAFTFDPIMPRTDRAYYVAKRPT